MARLGSFLRRSRKAIVGGLAAALVPVLLRYGVDIDIEALTAVLSGLFGAGVTYVFPNDEE